MCDGVNCGPHYRALKVYSIYHNQCSSVKDAQSFHTYGKTLSGDQSSASGIVAETLFDDALW